MRFKELKQRGFTLIEVLVASSVLFIVSAAVVGLSNSIIQGTAVTADSATANRLATEGLELITKIRDDKLKNADFTSGQFVWFDKIEDSSNYGWYKLEQDPFDDNLWAISENSIASNTITLDSYDFSSAETVEGIDLVEYHRFVCIEALGAKNDQDANVLNCNTIDGDTFDDGTRTDIYNCYSGIASKTDIFCEFTKDSLNKNVVTTDKIIPDGNAVKVRSVVVWNDKDVYRHVEVATIFTNWQSFAQ